MPEIKTRQVQKGTIKSLDRAAVMTCRLKDVQTRTKDLIDDPRTRSSRSPDEYASNRITGMAQDAGTDAVYMAEKTATLTAGKIRYALSQAQDGVPESSVRTQGFIRFRKRQLAETQQIAGRQRSLRIYPGSREQSIRNFANSRQLARTKGKEKAIREFAKQRTVVDSRKKRSLQNARVTKRAARRTGRMVQRMARRMRDLIRSVKAMIEALSAGGIVCLVIVLVCILFGAAFYFFGDDSSANYTPVSPEVEAYSAVISKYAGQYGIGEYTELIKAVMMQESGGRGADPMQASESGYNKKYPHSPGSIKDPEYSIQCGVQALASSLKEARCKNPMDMDRIRLALQGYNYGNGYISWAIARDGGYTVENASDFSDMQAKKHGWKSYGDKQYPAHVLRYYPYGNYNYGIGNGKIISVAAQQIGNRGGQKFWSWYGFHSRVEWCACFVSWCADQCGYIQSGTIPKFAAVGNGISWFKSHHQWQTRSYKPSAGDVIFFDWGGDGSPDHVGLVEKCDGRTVYTIEGNSSDTCRRRNYPVGGRQIYGYGVPKY